MPLRQKVFFLAVAVVLLVVIVELVRRRRLRVEYSWLWIASGATIILVILRYDLLVSLTGLIGAAIPTSSLFFLCIMYLALLSLEYSVRLSELSRQVKELAQELALLRGERAEAAPPGDDPPGPGPA
ncbi:MAG: DUF2304 domain-containing protein [Vicinamibacteria bacterium]